jgi:hypothetical protein
MEPCGLSTPHLSRIFTIGGYGLRNRPLDAAMWNRLIDVADYRVLWADSYSSYRPAYMVGFVTALASIVLIAVLGFRRKKSEREKVQVG